MEPLGPQQIRHRLSRFFRLDTSQAEPQRVLSVPFGKEGTCDTTPVVTNSSEVIHGAVVNPTAGSIITRRRQLTPGVYDVWWNFAVSGALYVRVSLQVEDSASNLRYGTGFTVSDAADGGASTGRLAFLTVGDDDEIVFRCDLTITGSIYFNYAITQRLP